MKTTNNIVKAKPRQANMELMRIVSILLVLLTHTLFMTNGGPMRVMINNVMSPIEAFFYTWTESLTLVCVNCFILISGYFGIKPKALSVLSLLFIVLFYRIILLAIGYYSGEIQLTLSGLYHTLNPLAGDWFVPAYIGLILFSPLLNALVDNSTAKQLKKYTIIYLAMMICVSIMPSMISFGFNTGYSTLSFVGLYLLARYYRLHGITKIRWSNRTWVAMYIISALIPTIIYFLITRIPDETYVYYHDYFFMNYDSPFNIFGALCLLIVFSRLKIDANKPCGKVINRLAMSAFSAYIIHLNPLILPFYKSAAAYIVNNFSFAVALPILLAYVVAIYLAVSIVDSIRIFLWDCISKRIKWNKSNTDNQKPAFE